MDASAFLLTGNMIREHDVLQAYPTIKVPASRLETIDWAQPGLYTAFMSWSLQTLGVNKCAWG